MPAGAEGPPQALGFGLRLGLRIWREHVVRAAWSGDARQVWLDMHHSGGDGAPLRPGGALPGPHSGGRATVPLLRRRQHGFAQWSHGPKSLLYAVERLQGAMCLWGSTRATGKAFCSGSKYTMLACVPMFLGVPPSPPVLVGLGRLPHFRLRLGHEISELKGWAEEHT